LSLNDIFYIESENLRGDTSSGGGGASPPEGEEPLLRHRAVSSLSCEIA